MGETRRVSIRRKLMAAEGEKGLWCRAKEHRQPLGSGKGKEKHFLLKSPEGTSLPCTFILACRTHSVPLASRIRRQCTRVLLSATKLGWLSTAATGHYCFFETCISRLKLQSVTPILLATPPEIPLPWGEACFSSCFLHHPFRSSNSQPPSLTAPEGGGGGEWRGQDGVFTF
jgi:hypothetical protein